MSNAIVQQVTNNGALNAEHYQTFEMAKANDDTLGGDNIAQIRASQARARAEAQAIYKMMSEMDRIEDVTTSKSELLETSQLLARYSVYGDQRIGEILRELPTKQGMRTDTTSVRMETEVTKTEAIKNAGIAHQQAIDLQKMAANPEVVEAVIAKAEAEGRIVSRSQVLKAIKERDEARKELSEAHGENLELGSQIAMLKRQVAERPEPEVIERTVEVVPEEVKRRIESLEYDAQVHADTDQKLRRQLAETRKKLDRAKVLLEGKGYEDNASWDISALTTATNTYLSRYGGKAWAFDQFYRVDEVTQQEFVKAITNLAAFAQSIVQYISDNNKLEA